MIKAQATIPKSRSTWPRWLALMLVLSAIFLLVQLIFRSRVSDGPLPNPAATQIQTPSSMKFDFYTVLPKMAVSPPTTPPPDPALSKTSPSPTYVLQVAAVRHLAEAERLRDDLHRQGVPAFIQSHPVGETLWYRVMIGPYTSPELARRQRDRINIHHK